MGEIAAAITSVFWTLSSLSFTEGGKKVGSLVVNRVRLVFAVILLMAAHLVILNEAIPLNAGWDRWFWLGLSGIIGLALGDAFLFQAFVMIGARLSMLIMASVPVISALSAWLFLGEMLAWYEIAGILLTVSGIAVVVLEKGNHNPKINNPRQYLLGILCAIGGAIGQALGMVLAKKGLYGEFNALSGVLMRMITAMITIWIITIVFRQAAKTIQILQKTPSAILWILLGAIAGPFLGVWASLIAIQATHVGIASTLMALTPIFMLPISKWVYKESVSWRAVIGTLTAIAGVGLLFIL